MKPRNWPKGITCEVILLADPDQCKKQCKIENDTDIICYNLTNWDIKFTHTPVLQGLIFCLFYNYIEDLVALHNVNHLGTNLISFFTLLSFAAHILKQNTSYESYLLLIAVKNLNQVVA